MSEPINGLVVDAVVVATLKENGFEEVPYEKGMVEFSFQSNSNPDFVLLVRAVASFFADCLLTKNVTQFASVNSAVDENNAAKITMFARADEGIQGTAVAPKKRSDVEKSVSPRNLIDFH